jgi:small nuclear ribonucleoprotein (snRNP)-like protein
LLSPILELTTTIETFTSIATMESEKAVEYLNGLIGRTLRIHATDGRMFVGLFKCTDAVSNLLVITIDERDNIRKTTLWDFYMQN